jgi:hypothetical protein
MRVIVDAHNESVRPFTHNILAMHGLLRLIMNRAFLFIVTNDELADVVRRLGGRPFVLPDAIPRPPRYPSNRPRATRPIVLIVCTYAADEPLEVFIETARRLSGSAEIRLTGRPNQRSLDRLSAAPNNLRTLGFLSEEDYWAELIHADVVVDLTLKLNCLVCGAYEAIAAGQSPVLTDDVSSRKLFRDVADYVENTADSLTSVINARLSLPPRAASSVHEFRERYMQDWRKRLHSLRAAIMM